MVLLLGPGCHLCKTDLESAYRILPVNNMDHDLVGIKWQNKYDYDNCLSMGLRRFSSCLKWLATKQI